MGEHINAVRSADALMRVPPLSQVMPDSVLPGYRAAVDDLAKEASRHPRASELAAVEELVSGRLREPELDAVLSHHDEGADAAAFGLLREIRNCLPNAHSSAINSATFIRILLLSQIDSVWWSGTAPFTSDADVPGSTELVELGALKSAKLLEFQYRVQPTGLFRRARDWARHKALPGLRPRVSGLRSTYSRPVVVAAVNQIALHFAAARPPRTPRIWVTSMVRSVEHQYRLRSLGYPAVVPSAHCAGYACDLEKSWFRRHDPDNLLGRLLFERQDAGQLNVIDEGQAWHLCINPNACEELQAVYDTQLRV